ncbi:hypothetical protein [Achromobacter aloeverae]
MACVQGQKAAYGFDVRYTSIDVQYTSIVAHDASKCLAGCSWAANRRLWPADERFLSLLAASGDKR